VSPSPSQDAIGLVVGNRYRLVASIGIGPSTRVYLADDVRLRRRVAVKLLVESLIDEPGFVSRFGAEMAAASALRHPHIVMVHDWGVDDAPFVVSEYLTGGSLRRLADRGVTLTPAQALQVALAAARALAYAHERGVVHRALHPANVMFTDDGRLEITDFGLARAHAEAASTRPMGAAVAAGRYASPEQARGSDLDGRADVYALGLVVIEAVSGRAPFPADTALATLMARIDRAPEIPDELGALAGPIARATTVDVAERLDAPGLVTALMAVADQFDEPGPLPLVDESPAVESGPDEAAAPTEDITLLVAPGHTNEPDTDLAARERGGGGDSGQDAPTVEVAGSSPAPDPAPPLVPGPRGDRAGRAGALASAAARPGPGVTEPVDGRPARSMPSGSLPAGSHADPAHADAAHADPASDDEPDDADARRARRNHRRWRVAWAVLAVVIVLGGGAVAFLVVQAQRTPTHAVPSVDGLNPTAAQRRLEALGFDVQTRHVRRDGTTAGQVLGVDPATGERVAEGDRVTLTVSAGQTLVTVPSDLVGATESTANSRLSGLGLVVGTPRGQYSEDVESGHVIGTEPDVGHKVEKGSPVAVVVSKGPRPRIVPDVAGMSPDEAEAALRNIGLVPNVTTRLDARVDKGGLIGLDPAPGTSVARGATVTVVVSAGLLVAVPGLDGVSTVAEAIARLQDAGLVANNLSGSGSLSGTPVAFDPPAGTMVAKGSPVNIVVR